MTHAYASTLMTFARDEIVRAGLADKDADYAGEPARVALAMLDVFTRHRPSGAEAAMIRSIFDRLSQHQPLAPITSDPAEWEDVTDAWPQPNGRRIHQNRRAPMVFSNDGGQTWFNVEESGEEKPVLPPLTPSVDTLMNALESAWGIIANVSNGNWIQQPGDWQGAAESWRDRYLVLLNEWVAATRGQSSLPMPKGR
jgi:hypothetical protein